MTMDRIEGRNARRVRAGPGQDEDKDRDTRTRILAAATEHFAQYGYEGARTQAIADAAGVNKAMLYYHFRGKRHLYRQTLKTHFHEIVMEVFPSFTDTTRDPGLRIVGIVRAYQSFLRDHPHMRALMLRELAVGAGGLHETLDELRREFPFINPQKMLEGLQEMMERGQLHAADPRQVFLHLVSLAIFPHIARPLIEYLWDLGPDEMDRLLEERPAAVSALLEQGLIRREVS
jgi:TetR/AcrR family transcriptional regulator